MNPELPKVQPSGEMMPQIPGGAEYFPDGTVRTPETLGTPEQARPAPVEQLTQSAQAAPVVPAIPVVAPPSVAPVSDTAVASDDTPAVAGDDDLIEREWVDKVKKIISLTKGNPYEQAKAITTLQADYLKKRYNRILGAPSEQ